MRKYWPITIVSDDGFFFIDTVKEEYADSIRSGEEITGMNGHSMGHICRHPALLILFFDLKEMILEIKDQYGDSRLVKIRKVKQTSTQRKSPGY
ncbi:hypothetical protein ACTHGU_10510 [Chitinophagaceae bacterium MMS25-I14]